MTFPPPQPPDDGRRFSPGAVVGGIVADFPILAVLVVGSSAVGASSSSAVSMPLGLGVLPVVIGIVLAIRGRSPRVRGFGLGLAIGWAVWGIVGAGVCFGLLALFVAGEGG